MKYLGDYLVTRTGRAFKKGKELRPYLHKGNNGSTYLRIKLTIDGKRKAYRVHRLVAMLYIPNPMGKPEVDHIDADTFNNRVTNLRWVSSAENNPYNKAV